MKFSYLHTVLLLFVLYSCSNINTKQTIDASNQKLMLDNGVLYYNTIPFTGNLVTYYSDNELKSDTQYTNGRKNGYEKQWYANMSLAVERLYTKGIKTGIHKAWWENGNPKFVYQFNDYGEYHGNTKEWYVLGQQYKDFNYIDGKEVGSQRLWKQDGNIKANYEVINDERFGLIGLKKCKTVTVNSFNVK